MARCRGEQLIAEQSDKQSQCKYNTEIDLILLNNSSKECEERGYERRTWDKAKKRKGWKVHRKMSSEWR